MPRVSVIIPVYNDTDRLQLCLDALAAQTYSVDQFEVIVVDNGSADPPRELVEAYSFCQFSEESKPGSYAARNRGLELAQGELLAFTDSDCLPCPEWLARGVTRLTETEIDGQLGGQIELFPEDPQRPTAVELYDIIFGLDQEANVDQFYFAATANMMTSRSVLDSVGPFPEVKSGGDTQWGRRLHDAGHRVVYAEEVLVKHPARKNLRDLLTQARRHAGGRYAIYRGRRKSMPWLRRLRNAMRIVSPPLAACQLATRRLRSEGHSWGQVFRVWKVIFQVKYSRTFATLRASLGFDDERR